jgi:hypothetical protein
MSNQRQFIRQTAAVVMACGLIVSLLPGLAAAWPALSTQDPSTQAPGARAEAIVPLDGPVLAGKPVTFKSVAIRGHSLGSGGRDDG